MFSVDEVRAVEAVEGESTSEIRYIPSRLHSQLLGDLYQFLEKMESIFDTTELKNAFLGPRSILSPSAAVALILAIIFYVLYVGELQHM